ncbi:MAG: hypothetical protein WCP28_18850 [Actinomycetes bacterium]
MRLSTRVTCALAATGIVSAGLVATPVHGQPEPAPDASAQASTVPVQTRGDVISHRGVPVIGATFSDRGRLVTARIYWNQQMIARSGHRDRFNVRLVAFGADGSTTPIVLSRHSQRAVPPVVQDVRIRLSKINAKKLRASSDVVLAVSQQYSLLGAHRNKHFRNYVTIAKVMPGASAVASTGRNTLLSPVRG